jgi:hypothetical protein
MPTKTSGPQVKGSVCELIDDPARQLLSLGIIEYMLGENLENLLSSTKNPPTSLYFDGTYLFLVSDFNRWLKDNPRLSLLMHQTTVRIHRADKHGVLL